MGKITEALKKAAEERLERIEKITKLKESHSFIVRRIGDSKVDPRVMTYFDPKATISEQYKILRTNILSINKGKPPKVLAITSSTHSEGKTVTALNLAVVLAQSTKKPKILLADADLRRGKVARYLGVEQKVGLTEILKGEATPDQCIFHLDAFDNLNFLPPGAVPENPAELVQSDKMRQFLTDVRMQYDHVIIDTPPIISVTDPGLIGSMADGVVMVLQAGRTQRGVLRRAIELLEQAHCDILGYVLTHIESHLPEYIYRYL